MDSAIEANVRKSSSFFIKLSNKSIYRLFFFIFNHSNIDIVARATNTPLIRYLAILIRICKKSQFLSRGSKNLGEGEHIPFFASNCSGGGTPARRDIFSYVCPGQRI